MHFVFGDMVVDCDQVKLIKHTKNIECEPRVFELLVYFCRHPQEAISRKRLLTEVWGGRTVSDAAVNRAIGELRKLIEDNPSSPKFIKTVSKVGYRLALTPASFENQYQLLEQEHATNRAVTIQTSEENSEAKDNQKIILYRNEQSTDESISPFSHLRKWRLLAVKTLKEKWLLSACLLLALGIFTNIASHSNVEKLVVMEKLPVTSMIGSAFNPSFNRKSNNLVFLYRENSDANAQIFIKQNDGSVDNISDDGYYYTDVIFGTDGYIYASRLNNLQKRYCEIVKVELITKQISSIIDCGKGVITPLEFDANKRRLLYRYRNITSEPYAIYSYQLDTGRKHQLTHPEQVGNNTGDYIFSISPDSKFLAIVEYNSNDVDKLKLVDLKDNRIIARTPFINDVHGLVWRSEYEVLASNSNGLFEFNVDNLSVTLIDNSDQIGRLAMGTDIHSLLTERSQKTVNIFGYSLQKSELKPLTASSSISQSPILGNISNILAFKSDRSGETEIYIKVEGQAEFIADFIEAIAHVDSMAWSPEDDNLIASINNHLYMYSLKNQKWQRLVEPFTNVHYASFVQKSIMFSAEVDGQWNIWQLSLENGQVKQITTKGGYSVEGYGSKIYLTKFNYDGLYQLDLNSGIESVLLEDFPIAAWRHWQLRDDKIYYLLNKDYKTLDLITASEKVLHSFSSQRPNTCNISYQLDFFACEKVELIRSNIWQFQLSPQVK